MLEELIRPPREALLDAQIVKPAGEDPCAHRPFEGLIGFVGLGRMGTAMGANLLMSGSRVLAYARRPERGKDLAMLGFEVCDDFSDLLFCDVVVTALPGDQAVRDVVFGQNTAFGLDGLLVRLMPGAVHLSMSTITPNTASELAAEHARYRQGYVAAPMFGDPDAALRRRLLIVAAGAAKDVEFCQPIFEKLGQRCFLVGSDPAVANMIKLAADAVSGATLELLEDVFAQARKRGLDDERLREILGGTVLGSLAQKLVLEKAAARRRSHDDREGSKAED